VRDGLRPGEGVGGGDFSLSSRNEKVVTHNKLTPKKSNRGTGHVMTEIPSANNNLVAGETPSICNFKNAGSFHSGVLYFFSYSASSGKGLAMNSFPKTLRERSLSQHKQMTITSKITAPTNNKESKGCLIRYFIIPR
jgi:hypothetical protein